MNLLEVICATGIVATILAVAVWGSGNPSGTAQTSASSVVEAELQAARQRALSEQKLVAVVVRPGNGGEVGVEVGLAGPRRERVTDLAREFKGAWVQVGPVVAPSPDAAVSAPWFAASRAALVFTPDGRMLSNLTPDGAGNVTLEVGTGGVADTRLTVSPAGQVARATTPGSARQAASGAPLSRSAGASQPPLFQDLTLHTSASVTEEDGVLTASVRPGTLLSLEAIARDADPDEQLFARWTGGGVFSQAVRAPMRYDAASGTWRAPVSWRPPDPQAADLTLRCEITDRQGQPAVDADGAAATTAFKVVTKPAVRDALVLPMDVFDSDTCLCALNSDGSGLRPLWRGTVTERPEDEQVQEGHPVISPDGTQVAYTSCATFPPDLVVRNLDGTNRRVLKTDWNGPGYPVMFWSATGSELFYVREHPTISDTGQLVRVRTDIPNATPTVVVANRKTDMTYVNPTHNKLAWIVRADWDASLEMRDLVSGASTTLATDLPSGSGSNPCCWTPAGNLLFITEDGLKQATPTFPSTVTDVLTKDDLWQIAVSRDGKIAATTDWGRKVFLLGTTAAPVASTTAIMTYVTSHLYSGGASQIIWGVDGRYLYYVQGPGSNSKVMRYDTQEGEAREMTRGLRTDDAATSAGGCTSVQVLP